MPEVGTDDADGGRRSRPDVELPTSFGKYFLTEKLATGGMAEIYLAKLIGPGGFEKQLVIKQIHPKLTGQRHFVDLFVAEAKTLVTLAHGNIVPVYELGVIDDTYFIAMDYIDGPTLYRLTETMSGRDAVMEPALAAWIVARILEGLDYAHRKGEGVIHRDLSPRNVMMSRDGEVKLVDFGIAVTLGEPGEGDASTSAPTGSFPYMSPEQVRREPLSGQTDLFSAGVLLWEMLVGRRLFARADAEATLEAVLHGEIPRPSSQRAEIPAKLDEVVMHALQRDRAQRWNDAAEMLAALNKYIYSLDETPGPREVAALVAKFCPQSTRRLPTHLEALGHDATEPVAQPGSGATRSAGPRTAVIPRDAAAPKGKKQRHQTFATHVDLKDMLERATPLFPIDAIVEPPPTPPVAAEPPPRRAGRGLLVAAGFGALALAAAALYVFYQNRGAVLHDDAAAVATGRDASARATLAPDAAPPDGNEPDGALLAPPIDAGHREPPRDAAIGRARPDAVPLVAPIDAGKVGTATLKIGANPWGEVYIDGKKQRGTAPGDFQVSAGHHEVEVVFPVDSPPAKRSFELDVATGETRSLSADFR